MYINDVHILYYVLAGILGIFLGQVIDFANNRLPEYKKVFCKDLFKKGFKKPNYILMGLMAIIYITLVYKFGISKDFLSNLDLFKFIIITPMLLSVFVIDYRLKIIPNRLNLILFEVGLVFLFLYGISNLNLALSMLLGMAIGGGIFLLITLIGGLIAGKEAMGFGDVKLMGALGLLFGMNSIIAIAVISFLLGAIISIVLLLSKIKKTNEYIPFGPFIILACFIIIYAPFSIIVNVLLKIFTLGMY